VLAYHTLTGVNICLMLLLAWRSSQPFFRLYLLVMAGCAWIQNTTHWGLPGEVILAAVTALWVVSELPRGRRALTEALALGAFLSAVLVFAVPAPWPRYSVAMYFTRLYSTAAFLGISVPCAILGRRNWLALPWFAAVLFAGSQRGWNYVAVAISANAVWTACLLGWLVMGDRTAATETPPLSPPE